MNVEQIIINAVSPYVTEVVPNKYTGTSKEYCVFNYDVIPRVFADSTPNAFIHMIQLHWFCGHKTNPNTKRKQIAEALHGAGTTFPSIVNASDEGGQHYVFECELEANL